MTPRVLFVYFIRNTFKNNNYYMRIYIYGQENEKIYHLYSEKQNKKLYFLCIRHKCKYNILFKKFYFYW